VADYTIAGMEIEVVLDVMLEEDSRGLCLWGVVDFVLIDHSVVVEHREKEVIQMDYLAARSTWREVVRVIVNECSSVSCYRENLCAVVVAAVSNLQKCHPLNLVVRYICESC
jgi:hypothetical protein